MSSPLRLADHATRDDLRIFLERLLRVGHPEVRIVVRGAVLAVFGCTHAPEGLTDDAPTVVVLRSFLLGKGPDEPVDTVVPARGVLDRLARLGILGLDLELPETSATAAWAGVLPPTTGWEPLGVVDAESLAAVAAEGIERVATALPVEPGEAVVRKVRRAVWGSEIAPGLPAAVAFAADALGFLGAAPQAGSPPRAPLRLSASRSWRRVSSEHGEVLVRAKLG